MSQATITIPDEMKQALEDYARRQDEPQELSVVIQTALQEFLERHDEFEVREYRPFRVTPIEEKDDMGESDVSVHHDTYFAEVTYTDDQ